MRLSFLSLFTIVIATACSNGRSAQYLPSDKEYAAAAKINARQLRNKEGEEHYKVGVPYQIDSTWYYPSENNFHEEVGVASWYGNEFHNRKTSNGEIFNADALTAAHRTLPMPSIVKVTNIENGKTVRLRVNDRGPFAKNRVIDVSRAAAAQLGFIGQGTARVKVEFDRDATNALFRDGGSYQADAKKWLQKSRTVKMVDDAVEVASASKPVVKPLRTIEVASVASGKSFVGNSVNVSNLPEVPMKTMAQITRDENVEAAEAKKLAEIAPAAGKNIRQTEAKQDSYIQVGSYKSRDSAERVMGSVKHISKVELLKSLEGGKTLYKVKMGPFKTPEAQERASDNLSKLGYKNAFLSASN